MLERTGACCRLPDGMARSLAAADGGVTLAPKQRRCWGSAARRAPAAISARRSAHAAQMLNFAMLIVLRARWMLFMGCSWGAEPLPMRGVLPVRSPATVNGVCGDCCCMSTLVVARERRSARQDREVAVITTYERDSIPAGAARQGAEAL